jgi:hypothetical protein
VVALSMNTGIPFREWAEGDERALHTALELLTENDDGPSRMREGPQMSG